MVGRWAGGSFGVLFHQISIVMLPVIFAVFAFCFILERLIPGWKLPAVPTWTIRVLAINFVQLIVVVVAGYTWEKWLSAHSVFHLSRYVGNVGGGVLGYVVATFIFYWWHRWRHTVDFLWLHFHRSGGPPDSPLSAAARGHHVVLQAPA